MVRILAALAVLLAVGQAASAQTPGQAAPPAGVSNKRATEVDGQVLEALLLAIASDTDFPCPSTPEKPQVVLHRRTPKGVEPLISTSMVMYDTGGRELPKDAWDDLVRRNVVRLDPNAREIRYEGLAFDSRIQVGNCFPGPEPPFLGKTFEDVFPQARGWVEAWVPGYSKDHKTAVVRARVGPTEKPAMLTAILKLEDGKWAVAWRRYSVYN